MNGNALNILLSKFLYIKWVYVCKSSFTIDYNFNIIHFNANISITKSPNGMNDITASASSHNIHADRYR